jgi:hypothetical protein
MGKWGNESAALSLEIAAPAPDPDEREQTPEQGPEGGYEDTWYRTLRVMSGSPEAAGVERTGALGENRPPQPQPNTRSEAQSRQEVRSQPPTHAPAIASQPASQDPSETDDAAPQKSADSYEDNWYQILRSRQAAGEAD